MSEDAHNLEAVRRLQAAGMGYIKRGEREPLEAALRELSSEDIVFVPSSALASGDSGPFHGREGVLRQHEAIARQWADFDVVVDEYVDVPPSIVVLLGKLAARRDDGSGYAMEFGLVNRFEEGRLVSVHSYESKRRALEAAGARELSPGERSQ